MAERELIEIRTYGDAEPIYIEGACDHVDTLVSVESVTGETVAHLCTDCNTQLPADWPIDG